MIDGCNITNGVLDIKEENVVLNRDSVDLTNPGVALKEGGLVLKGKLNECKIRE